MKVDSATTTKKPNNTLNSHLLLCGLQIKKHCCAIKRNAKAETWQLKALPKWTQSIQSPNFQRKSCQRSSVKAANARYLSWFWRNSPAVMPGSLNLPNSWWWGRLSRPMAKVMRFDVHQNSNVSAYFWTTFGRRSLSHSLSSTNPMRAVQLLLASQTVGPDLPSWLPLSASKGWRRVSRFTKPKYLRNTGEQSSFLQAPEFIWAVLPCSVCSVPLKAKHIQSEPSSIYEKHDLYI